MAENCSNTTLESYSAGYPSRAPYRIDTPPPKVPKYGFLRLFCIRIPKIGLPAPLVTSYTVVPMDPTCRALLDSENSDSDEGKNKIPAKRGRKRARKKSRPTVHPKFAGRGARDLFHEERGFIRCWMELHPEESQRDLAARFSVGVGVIAGLVASTMTAYEQCINARKGRRPHLEEAINAWH